MSLRQCCAVFLSSSDSLGSKHILSVDCMISQMLSLVSNNPTLDRVNSRITSVNQEFKPLFFISAVNFGFSHPKYLTSLRRENKMFRLLKLEKRTRNGQNKLESRFDYSPMIFIRTTSSLLESVPTNLA